MIYDFFSPSAQIVDRQLVPSNFYLCFLICSGPPIAIKLFIGITLIPRSEKHLTYSFMATGNGLTCSFGQSNCPRLALINNMQHFKRPTHPHIAFHTSQCIRQAVPNSESTFLPYTGRNWVQKICVHKFKQIFHVILFICKNSVFLKLSVFSCLFIPRVACIFLSNLLISNKVSVLVINYTTNAFVLSGDRFLPTSPACLHKISFLLPPTAIILLCRVAYFWAKGAEVI